MMMTRLIATAGFVISFLLAFTSGNVISTLAAAYWASIVKETCVVEMSFAYRVVTWILSGLLGIAAGIHSFRATARLYRKG